MSGRSLLPRQRQDVIQDLLRAQRFATVRELASAVGVSPMTVRRDLESLQSDGHVRRVYGGAKAIAPTPSDATVPEQRYAERMMENRDAKILLGREAARDVGDGDTVALDGSTTAVYLAHQLRDRPITVVTNNLLIVNELSGGTATVFVPGGMVRETTHTLVGDAAVKALEGFNANVVFFSCTGFHPDAGLSDSNAEEVAVKRALFRLSARRVALIDGSKYGRTSLMNLLPLREVEAIVTDRDPGPALRRTLAAAGTRLRVAHG